MVSETIERPRRAPHGFGGTRANICIFVDTDLTVGLQAGMGDDILNHVPTADQEGIWEAGTRLPFDPFVSSAILEDVDVECPKCERQINVCKCIPCCFYGCWWTVLNSN